MGTSNSEVFDDVSRELALLELDENEVHSFVYRVYCNPYSLNDLFKEVYSDFLILGPYKNNPFLQYLNE